ncbi:MAG: T9SS type A sorting domain-containing protein [Bacteroidota bacterium]|nr:T9SS type A sorting domain-containing protein [Bacteroidota bacterium]MDP4231277.1 T9SS type A sorting domain-containing protein [Bacteroidota bacterium]MDP4236138.1 T9SS type A sorting domain-containing protein [Bacteroidota bacterium]
MCINIIMMPHQRRIVFVLLFVSASAGLRAQTVQQMIEKECSSDPNGKFLFDHSDAYRNRILRRIRLQFGSAEAPHQSSPAILSDAGSKDIFYDASDQNETTIAINRRDPNLIIAGSNDQSEGDQGMIVYVTKDGGLSWHTSRLPPLPEDRLAAGDPVIAASDDGRFYYAFLTNPKYAPLPIQLVVAVSVDGENWTDMQPVGVQPAERSFQDKPAIAVDNSPFSSHYGRVYTAWTLTSDDKPYDGLRLSYTDDHGKTWSKTKVLTDQGNNLFAQVCTGRNGEVLVSYGSLDDSLHEVLLSLDGGKTFQNRSITAFIPYPSNNADRPSLKGAQGFRAYPCPSMAIDLLTNRLHVVYGTWMPWNEKDSSAALLYTFSDDLGASWMPPVPVGETENTPQLHRDHFFPWMAYDESTHETSLIYYSSEADPGNLFSKPYRAIITDQLNSFFSPIGDSLFDPLYSSFHSYPAFIGDYIGCDAHKNRFAAAWTQNRPNHDDGDVFAYVGTTDTLVSSVGGGRTMKLNSDRLWLSECYPNPVTSGSATVSFTVAHSCITSLDLFSEDGKFLRTLFSEQYGAGSYSRGVYFGGLSAGAYTIRLRDENQSVDREVIVLR